MVEKAPHPSTLVSSFRSLQSSHGGNLGCGGRNIQERVNVIRARFRNHRKTNAVDDCVTLNFALSCVENSSERLEPEQVTAGKAHELSSLIAHGVFEFVRQRSSQTQRQSIIGSRRIRDKICDGERARLVAEEISWKALSDTFVGTASLEFINGIFSLASSKAPQYE